MNISDSRGTRTSRRTLAVTVAAVVAVGCFVLSAVAAAPKARKPTGKAAMAAEANAMPQAGDKNATDAGPSIRLPGDPPEARLKIKDDFNVDQPVTAEMLASLNAAPPAGADKPDAADPNMDAAGK